MPLSIERLVKHAIELLKPEKIILFGSRARGDSRAHSDYDLAFVLANDNNLAWARFLVDVEEAPLTLLPVNLVAWSEADEDLRRNIAEEGIALYG